MVCYVSMQSGSFERLKMLFPYSYDKTMLRDQQVSRSVNHSDRVRCFTRTPTSLHSSEENLNTQSPRRKSYLNDSPICEENSNIGLPVRLTD